MTFLEAAEKVLRATPRPLTTREVVDEALRLGLIEPTGKTPRATMSAALYGLPADSPIKRVYEKGPARAVRGSVRWRYEPPAS